MSGPFGFDSSTTRPALADAASIRSRAALASRSARSPDAPTCPPARVPGGTDPHRHIPALANRTFAVAQSGMQTPTDEIQGRDTLRYLRLMLLVIPLLLLVAITLYAWWT